MDVAVVSPDPGVVHVHPLMADGLPGSLATCWPVWLAAQGLGQLAPRRWISVNYTHQQVQAALAGQGVALARLAMVHDVVERGDLVEPFGQTGRLWASPGYWLVRLGGPDARQRPEVQSFSDWVLAQAALTRQAIGDVADPEAETLPDLCRAGIASMRLPHATPGAAPLAWATRAPQGTLRTWRST